MMLTSSQKALAAIIYTLAILGIGFTGGAWITNSIAARAQLGAERGAAAEIAKLKPLTTVVNNKVVELVRTEKVYQECQHSPEAFKTILEAYK